MGAKRQTSMEKPKTLSSFGGKVDETKKSTAFAFKAKAFSRSNKPQSLLIGLNSALHEKDLNFLECMRLCDEFHHIDLHLEMEAGDNTNNARIKCLTLADFFAQLATEERKHADLIFEWLFITGGLHSENTGDCKSDIAVTMNVSEEDEKPAQLLADMEQPLFGLQRVMQRRASHIATLLELRTIAEKALCSSSSSETSEASGFLQFARANDNKLFRSQEETNKMARRVLLCLERDRKNKRQQIQ